MATLRQVRASLVKKIKPEWKQDPLPFDYTAQAPAPLTSSGCLSGGQAWVESMKWTKPLAAL